MSDQARNPKTTVNFSSIRKKYINTWIMPGERPPRWLSLCVRPLLISWSTSQQITRLGTEKQHQLFMKNPCKLLFLTNCFAQTLQVKKNSCWVYLNYSPTSFVSSTTYRKTNVFPLSIWRLGISVKEKKEWPITDYRWPSRMLHCGVSSISVIWSKLFFFFHTFPINTIADCSFVLWWLELRHPVVYQLDNSERCFHLFSLSNLQYRKRILWGEREFTPLSPPRSRKLCPWKQDVLGFCVGF